MITMTSLEAQNNFGALLDTSQREPVLITRRGRPVSIVISSMGEPAQALKQAMNALREVQSPSRLQAAKRLVEWLEERKLTPSVAESEGLTEENISRMVDEEREAIAAERIAAKQLALLQSAQ